MQKDFHYCTIKLLAQKAGFPPNEAQIIAYSSQFVDDSTAYRPFRLPFFVKTNSFRIIKNKYLDPVCTAHKGIQMISDFNKNIQKKVYISFHFLPAEPYKGQKNYSFITQPDSEFANLIVSKALNNFGSDTHDRIFKLINLGIALHTYADTFSHQGFSGRHNQENNVEEIKIFKKNSWQKISKLKSIRASLLPEIGHAEAINLPDLPFLKWAYKVSNDIQVERDNRDIFMTAAYKIYNFLCNISPQKPAPFASFAHKLYKIYSSPIPSASLRFFTYQLHFPEIYFFYNPRLWFLELFNPTIGVIGSQKSNYKLILFYEAAHLQRSFVLENIPNY